MTKVFLLEEQLVFDSFYSAWEVASVYTTRQAADKALSDAEKNNPWMYDIRVREIEVSE